MKKTDIVAGAEYRPECSLRANNREVLSVENGFVSYVEVGYSAKMKPPTVVTLDTFSRWARDRVVRKAPVNGGTTTVVRYVKVRIEIKAANGVDIDEVLQECDYQFKSQTDQADIVSTEIVENL